MQSPASKQPTSLPAIRGGQPVLPEGPPSWPIPDRTVLESLQAAFEDGSWGQYVAAPSRRLKQQLSELVGVPLVTLCSSGTIAVELALRGLGVEPGDEVILAGYDFPGNFRAIESIRAVPVLVDIDPDNWCLDSRHLPAARTSATRALVVSHLHGGLAAMAEIVSFARRHGIGVVEDACQAPGATVDGRVAGAWGDAGVLSFGGSKLLSAGRGGALLTADRTIQQRVTVHSERGNSAFPLSELQAAVLPPQIDHLSRRNAQRATAVQRLLDQLEHLRQLEPLCNRGAGSPSYYKVAWRLHASNRAEFLAAMQAEGVAMDAGFRGFARRSDRRCRKPVSLKHSLRASRETVLLHHPVLLEPVRTMDQIAEAVDKVLGHLAADSSCPG